ncbi:MAG: dihydrolipoyl dehydrogenase [Rickettsiaceae bacterium]|nr:dihydrolipoyl dehydrogenase [Rickettsiaceae bacterium]
MENYDVVVIGAGPGGYVAAIKAAQLGLKTAVIEKNHLGGVCLNWGCIPTKSLLKSAEIYTKLSHVQDYGIEVSKVKFDLKKIVARSREISNQLVTGIKALLKKNKVTVIEGAAKIKNKNEITINHGKKDLVIAAKNIIIATGARAKILKGYEPDGKNIWSYKEALMPDRLPKSMIVVGSGAIGIEFASFYNALGVDVTVLEAQPQILPVEDEEISLIAKKSFEERGIKFYTGVNLEQKRISKNEITLDFEHNGKKQKIKSEILLMAVGITANTEDLGLETTKIKLDRGHIVTDSNMQTAEKGIYAIGDVTMPPWLAHVASHEGIIASECIAGVKGHKINKNNIPACTYSSPQIASVGLTEKGAKSAGYDIKVGRFPFYANGKALILGDNKGLIKTIFDAKTGELLGAHMVGCDVTELIQGYVIAKEAEVTEQDLMKSIFPHPTLSEMMHESVLQAYNVQIHI